MVIKTLLKMRDLTEDLQGDLETALKTLIHLSNNSKIYRVVLSPSSIAALRSP